jgi:hypothetical protein
MEILKLKKGFKVKRVWRIKKIYQTNLKPKNLKKKTNDTIIRINIKIDGSVYHLNLKPENIAHDIIFVGDQNRVEKITQFLTALNSTQKKRVQNPNRNVQRKRITVMSTN